MSYKLTYFAVRGIVEPIRMMLTDNEIPFIDDRIATREEWPKMKSNFVSLLKDQHVHFLELDESKDNFDLDLNQQPFKKPFHFLQFFPAK